MTCNQITTLSIEERKELASLLRMLRKLDHLEGRVLIDSSSRALTFLKNARGVDSLISELMQIFS